MISPSGSFFAIKNNNNHTQLNASAQSLPIIGEEEIMSQKEHGTSSKPVMKNLKWNCDYETADRICNFNRHYAEYAGYWQSTTFIKDIREAAKNNQIPMKFYDAVTGKLLFTAPIGRTVEEFLMESASHGWPSFRDEEVNWDYVRCLQNGEAVSVTGTHLGHNIPDKKGNRYCINLVCVAGEPVDEK
jgi:peptide methionine sulfoxide reductase MsrB